MTESNAPTSTGAHGSSSDAMTREHDEVWALLPWYVNETLDPEETARVERHLAECEPCRRELVSQKRLRSAISDHSPADARMEKALARAKAALAAEAEAEAGPEREPVPALPPRMAARGGARSARQAQRASPQGWRLAGAAAVACLFVALTFAIGPRFLSPSAPDAPFVTVTDPSAGGTMVRIQTIPQVDRDALDALLSAKGLSVVDGPTGANVYTLRIDTDADLAAATRALEQSELVVLVVSGQQTPATD
ncbi:MAG: zf-HC2 domain-containing protein [Pseudomonadota bacterium]